MCPAADSQLLSSSSSTVSLRSSTTASTSARLVALPTLSRSAFAATSSGTPQLSRMCDGLFDRDVLRNSDCIAAVGNEVSEVTCFHCLSGRRRRRWPAASCSWTITSSLRRDTSFINHSKTPFSVGGGVVNYRWQPPPRKLCGMGGTCKIGGGVRASPCNAGPRIETLHVLGRMSEPKKWLLKWIRSLKTVWGGSHHNMTIMTLVFFNFLFWKRERERERKMFLQDLFLMVEFSGKVIKVLLYYYY